MDMSNAIVYVDTAEVREGALEELKAASKELVDFVDANVPRLIAYNVYLSDDGARITVVHVHPDSASLEYHMEVAGPVFCLSPAGRGWRFLQRERTPSRVTRTNRTSSPTPKTAP
jgi:hypothetical protein